jgi:hypothetical protein
MRSKVFTFAVTIIAFLAFSCSSGPKSVKFNELESKDFILSNVLFMTSKEGYDLDDSLLFAKLPVLEVIRQIESKYEVTIDRSLLNSNTEIKRYSNLVPNRFISLDTKNTQRVSIQFQQFSRENDLRIFIHFSIFKKDKKIAETAVTLTGEEIKN